MLLYCKTRSKEDLHDAQLIHVYAHQDKWRNQRQAAENWENVRWKGRINAFQKG